LKKSFYLYKRKVSDRVGHREDGLQITIYN